MVRYTARDALAIGLETSIAHHIDWSTTIFFISISYLHCIFFYPYFAYTLICDCEVDVTIYILVDDTISAMAYSSYIIFVI